MTDAKSGRCPRCQGFVAIRDDQYGRYHSCVMCGWVQDVEPAPRETRAEKEATAVERDQYAGRAIKGKPTYITFLLEVGDGRGQAVYIEVDYLLENPSSKSAMVQDVRGWPVQWHRNEHRMTDALRKLAAETGLTLWNFRAALR